MHTLLKIYKLKMEKSGRAISVVPKRVFGLRTEVAGNVHFISGQDIIYPAAGALVIQDFVTNKQKYMRFPENTCPEIIVISPNRKFVAVSERNLKTEKTLIIIYDLETLKKIKSLALPPECPTQSVGNMCFTNDSKGMAVLSSEPDAFINIYTFDKSDTVITGRASNKNYPGRATLLVCNPGDTSIVSVGGDNMLKIMNKTEKGFGQLGTIKGEDIVVTSITWLSTEIIIAGSANMELYFVEGGDLKAKYGVIDLEVIDLTSVPEGDEMSAKSELSSIASIFAKKIYPILCLTTFPNGFAFATNNMVHVFEKESQYKFLKKTLLTIPITIYDEALYVIKNISINEKQDTIVATTEHSQIYIGKLFAPETLDVTQIEFKYLGEPLHIDNIIGLSVCIWKPIAMTTSKDHTIRIWNYETMKVELVKKYLIDIQVVSLHPSGLFAAIGFTSVLRLVEILLDDLKIVKSFNYPMTTVLEFSHSGHLLAAACEKQIVIICVFTFETVITLKGHSGAILSLAWSTDDRYLVSSGKEGSVYEWDVITGQRVNELVQKGTLYTSLVVTSDQSSIIGVTHSSLMREISKSQMTREFPSPDPGVPFTSLTLARSDLMLFACNENGNLYSVKMPFMESGGGVFTNIRFYHTTINKVCMTFDDQMLITIGADGTLVFWSILNCENRTASVLPELLNCGDIIISRKELIEKNESIQLLETRLNEQMYEFQYEKKQGENSFSQQMKEIHESYCSAIEDLKQKNEALQANHVEQMNELTAQISKLQEKHQRETEKLEANFNEKIIVEYENTTHIKQKMAEMREEYEEKLKRSTSCLQETIESLENDFKLQLEERQKYTDQLVKEMEQKEKEFVDYCKQVEIDNDRNMVESQLSYEKRLKESDETITKWRGDAGVLKKKNSVITKECEELRKDVENLRSQQSKFKERIKNYQTDVEDLKKEITERENTIKDKEKRLGELQKKNQELEKYKQVLTHKMNELKSEIEPREIEIKEKKEQIFEMERELKNLQHSNTNLNLKVSEMKDKLIGFDKDLKSERVKNRTARAQLMRICSDIYEVSNYIQRPDKLKEEVKNLYLRYANDPELKKTLSLDSEVQNEFNRQREHFEKLLMEAKAKQVKKKSDTDTVKMLKENVALITELNKLRVELNDLKKQNSQMQSILGMSGKSTPSNIAKRKLEKAVMENDQLENKYRDEIQKLEDTIKTMATENQNLRMQLSQMG